jgi:membrane-associated phospholipid phosphatase
MKVLLLILLIAAPAGAGERTPFLWTPPHRHTANAISWGTAIGSVALDTVRSFKSEHRKTALLEQTCGLGVAGLAMRTTKHFVSRMRPDGSDNRSFYSGHTTYSAVSARTGYGFGFSVILSIDTAFFRQAAGKHFASDTIVGALAGVGSEALCRAIIPGDR